MALGQPVDLLSQRNLEWHHQTKCLVFFVTLARHHAAWSSAVSTQCLDRRGQHLEGRKEERKGGREEGRPFSLFVVKHHSFSKDSIPHFTIF